MNITQVGSFPPPYGGQSVHIENIQGYLLSRRHNCYVFNTGANKEISDNKVINIKSTFDLALKLFTNNSELLHSHCATGGSLYKLVVCYLVSVIRRQKIVVTLHSGDFPAYLNSLKGIKKYLLLKILKSHARLICVNDRIAASLMNEGIHANRILIAPAFSIDVDLSEVELSTQCSGFIDSHNPLLSCMGFFQPQYGLELVLEAIAELKSKYPQIGLVVLSSGESDNFYFEKVKYYKCDDHVLVVRDLPHLDSLKVLSKSTLFIRPTFYDGDAISVREALAIGVPVIASDTDYRPAGSMLFRKGDVQDLILKVKDVLIRNSGKSKIFQRVTENSNLQKILGCYEGILKNKKL